MVNHMQTYVLIIHAQVVVQGEGLANVIVWSFILVVILRLALSHNAHTQRFVLIWHC